MQEALERNAAINKPAHIRPWIQGFTAGWVRGHITYDYQAIRVQIRAAYELGIDEYFVWDARNEYDPKAFIH